MPLTCVAARPIGLHCRTGGARCRSETVVPVRKGSGMDPNPDYDASDEVEYFFSWLPWALRGVYPPPAYPPV
ncbi:hypothetical protein MANY_42690 [Mycolicibacterium anyangense]|uniref:Uncharacterized protein n=4 Tax=Mycobacteriaceae TaxID=1762 RepID=A0A6N4WG84_9MYCO|nr:hypothetical protein MANY_42690 [Mycolicibacterium anyangense]